MAITRTKPEGWAFAEVLTATQLNNLDTNAANALDKRSGQTDTLASDVTVTGSLSIQGVSEFAPTSTIEGTMSLSDASLVVDSASGITVETGGQLVFEGTGYPSFSAPRTFKRQIPMNILLNRIPLGISEWANVSPSINASVGGGFINTNADTMMSLEIPSWVGASLTKVEVYYRIPFSHFPTQKLSGKVTRIPPSNPDAATDLVSGFANGADAATYYASGAVQTLTLTGGETLSQDSRYLLTLFSDSDIGGNIIYGAAAFYSVSNLSPQ